MSEGPWRVFVRKPDGFYHTHAQCDTQYDLKRSVEQARRTHRDVKVMQGMAGDRMLEAKEVEALVGH